jgi:hypothetical protein
LPGYINLFADYLIRFKNPVFREEREWRLVSLGDIEDIEGVHIHYRDTRFGLVPYLKYRESTGNRRLPITRVVQGPRVEPELAATAVDGYLVKCGYRVPVDLSKVPLRY